MHITLLFAATMVTAHAEIQDVAAVRAIVGEAANQGRTGMLAIACAIRNRGTLRGVYGLHNPCVDNQPAWVWQRARLAWVQSQTNDITCGATAWENTRAFGTPWWAKTMRPTARIGDHQFYGETGKAGPMKFDPLNLPNSSLAQNRQGIMAKSDLGAGRM